MFTSDVSETVLRLFDSGSISWPRSVSDRNKFIAENFGKVWDNLLDINIYGENDTSSGKAWDALGEILMLVLVLEDALWTDITPLSEYDEPNDFSVKKAKIRSRIRP